MASRGRDQIDWNGLRARIEAAAYAEDADSEAGRERTLAILRERARRLARPLDSTEAGEDRSDVATFDLVNEHYAIEARYVLEVIRLRDLTPLPRSPVFLLGLSNVRGTVLAIYDLRPLLGIEVRGLSDLTRIVVLGHDAPDMGILADAVHEVVALPLARLRPAPRPAESGNRYIRGVFDNRLIVLDGARLLDDERLHVGRPS